jgi:hypothetical protein
MGRVYHARKGSQMIEYPVDVGRAGDYKFDVNRTMGIVVVMRIFFQRHVGDEHASQEGVSSHGK